MRKQIVEANKGIVDLAKDHNHSESRQGYLHCSGTEFTDEWLGSLGDFITELVGDASVVEIGCGSGIISKFCRAYVGLDGNVDAGNCCVGEFFPVDLSEPYDFDPPVEADMLLSFNFLEHIEEDRVIDVLRHVDRLLKPGGRVFFVVDPIPAHSEHVTCHPEPWWDTQFQAVGWLKQDIPAELRERYYNNMPRHWRIWGLQNSQKLFLYTKP